MEKNKIVALIGSLQAAIVSFISAFTAVWNINRKLKEKLKYIHYLLFPSWTPNVFVPEFGVVNVNVTLKSIYSYKTFIVISSNVHDLIKHKYIA